MPPESEGRASNPMDNPPPSPRDARPDQDATVCPRMMGKPVLFSEERILNPTSDFKPKLLCGGPTFTAGTACAFTCSYCYVEDVVGTKPYVKQVRGDRPFQDVVIRRRDAVTRLRAALRTHKGKLKYKGGKWGEARAAGHPAVCYGSPLVDIAATRDLTEETIQMVKILLADTDWDLRLLSKSSLIRQIAQSLTDQEKPRVIFGLSTGTFNDALARAIEPTCPSPSTRFKAHRWLQEEGFRTFGMLCPILPQPMDRFVEQVAEQIRPERCEHVWAEAINVRGPSMARTIAALEGRQFRAEADAVRAISGKGNKGAWEEYARQTFLALVPAIPSREDGPRLRFMQYVTKATAVWWREHQNEGAVVLGAAGEGQEDTPLEAAGSETASNSQPTPQPPALPKALNSEQLANLAAEADALGKAAAEVARAVQQLAECSARLKDQILGLGQGTIPPPAATSQPPSKKTPNPKRSAGSKRAWIKIWAKRAAKAAAQAAAQNSPA